jgi:N-acetylmuramoyl-L-alanine amidase
MALLFAFAAMLPAGSAAAEDAADGDFATRVAGMAEITDVRLGTSKDKTRVVLESTKPLSYRKMTLSNPSRVVIDIDQAWLSAKVKRQFSTKSSFIGNVRLGQFDKKTVRVVIETNVGRSNQKFFKLSGPNRLVLDFGSLVDTSGSTIALPDVNKPVQKPSTETPETQKPATEPVVKPATDKKNTDKKNNDKKKKDEAQKQQEAQQAQKEQQEQKEQKEQKETQPAQKDEETPKDSGTQEQQPVPSQPATTPEESSTDAQIDALTGLKGKIIAIDPGHGGNDSGAIGPTGLMEKDVTLNIALKLQKLLQSEGATVYMTRTTDTEVSPKGADASDVEELQARCDVGNNHKADIFVSIHMDSYVNGSAQGTTGYYYAQGSENSRRLADKIRQDVIAQIGTQSRGTQSCHFYVCKHTDMPATLVEVAFISNPEEEKLLRSEAGTTKAAQGIADGINDYFG